MEKITSFKVMDVLERALQMEDVIHLEIGEPDFDTPEEVKEEGIRAIREEKIGYTHSLGMEELRDSIARYYNRFYGTKVNAENVIVTSGTSPALLIAIYVVMDNSRKNEILVSNPGYACYPNFITFLNGKKKEYNLMAEEGFRINPERIRKEITENTAGILINTPSNPIGNVISPEEMKAIAGLGKTIISDEIYQGLVYKGKKYDSILNYTDDALVLNGFSKLFAMTGWRLGYLIVPDKFIDLTQKLGQNLFISANTVSQYAAIKALNDGNVEKKIENMVEEYDKRRKFAISELKRKGFKIAAEPEGAYYIIIDMREYTKNSLEFTFEILENARVAVTPGIDFGSNLEGYIRISYATSLENIREGITRLNNFIKKCGKKKKIEV